MWYIKQSRERVRIEMVRENDGEEIGGEKMKKGRVVNSWKGKRRLKICGKCGEKEK